MLRIKITIFIVLFGFLGLSGCQKVRSGNCFQLAADLNETNNSGYCSETGFIIDVGGTFFLADTDDEFTSTIMVGLNPPPGYWITKLQESLGKKVFVQGKFIKIDNSIIALRSFDEFQFQ